MTLPKLHIRDLFWLVLVVGMLIGGLALVAKTIPRSVVYVVVADFESLPPDDKQLTEWLKEQPGVIKHTVHVQRRRSNQVQISFIQSQNLLGEPTFPNVEGGSKWRRRAAENGGARLGHELHCWSGEG